MGTGRSSARPEDLRSFSSTVTQHRAELADWFAKLTGSYERFQNAPTQGKVDSGLVEKTVPTFLNRQQDTITFVDLVRAAFESADSGSINGVVSVADASLQAAFDRAARASNLDPAQFNALPAGLDVPPAHAGAIPQSSGFVNDPVCTATGHFLEDEIDFVLPDRLEVLAWPRRYSSRLLAAGPLGRGWFTWASVRLTVDGRGDAAYRGPDGQQLVFAMVEDGWSRVEGIGARVAATAYGIDMSWDAATTFPLHRWHFDGAGRLATVWAPMLGTTTMVHDGDRLVRLEHEGGRALDLTWDGDRIVTATQSDGRTVRYRYDDLGDLVGVERAAGDHRYEPDERGRIVSAYDADGVRLCHNTYDDDGRVLRQVSPLGRETVFEYLPGRTTRVSDTTGGPAALYEHDALGRVTGLVNAVGDRFERRFDDRGRVVHQRRFEGATWDRVEPTADGSGDDDTLPAGGETVERADGGGGWERWRYDDLGRIVAHETGGGAGTPLGAAGDHAVSFAYDGDSSLPSRLAEADGSALTIEWVDGRPATVTDPDGVRVELEHDADGCPRRMVNGLGAVTAIEPHATGRPARVLHPDGTEDQLTWDDAGRLVAVHDASGGDLRIEHTPAGRVVAVTDPEGARAEIGYGPAGMVEQLRDPLGRRSELRYGNLTNLVGISEANGGTWAFDWSPLGQLSRVHAPDGGSWSTTHDAEGRATALLDPLGRVTRAGEGESRRPSSGAGDAQPHVTRTPAGRIATMTDGSGRVTRYGYDAAGRLATVTEPGGGVWHHEHDRCDRVVAVTSPEGRRTSYAYDASGRLAEVERGGSRQRYRYDRCGRLVAAIDPVGATTRYRYDAAGQLIEATDPRGVTVRYRHDELGKLVETADPFGVAVRIGRDVMGHPVEQTDALDRATRWAWDATGELTGVGLPTGAWIPADPATDADPQPSTEPVPAGRVEQRSYDADGRLVRTTDSRFGTVELTRDRDGLLTGLVAAELLRAWTYDDAGRLVDYREQTPSGAHRSRLRRDAAGRVIEVREQRAGDAAEVVTAYDYDEAGQLVAVRRADGDRTFAYDEAGRLVAESGPQGLRRLAYDAAGQLTSVQRAAATVSYRYDEAGRRVAERGEGRERTYQWSADGDLQAIVHDGRVTRVEVDRSGALARVGDAPLTWEPGGAGEQPVRVGDEHVLTVAGRVVATATGDDPAGEIRWCAADWRGSVSPRDEWGRRDPAEQRGPVGLGFLGEVELDGLVWLRNRVYDPETGQFLSRDPLAGVAGTPVATHPYHYAGNDPLLFVDPLGLQPLSIDQYNQYRDQATGIQWENVAMAALTIVGGALCVVFPVAAPFIGIAFGVASAGLSSYFDYKKTGEWDWATFAKDAVIGAAFGAIGGGFTRSIAQGALSKSVVAPFFKSLAGEMTSGGVFGFAGAAGNEAYDMSTLPGARNDDFNWGTVWGGTFLGAAGGAVGKGAARIKESLMPPPPTPKVMIEPPPRLVVEPPPKVVVEAPTKVVVEPPAKMVFQEPGQPPAPDPSVVPPDNQQPNPGNPGNPPFQAPHGPVTDPSHPPVPPSAQPPSTPAGAPAFQPPGQPSAPGGPPVDQQPDAPAYP